jgi:hypothetical protein
MLVAGLLVTSAQVADAFHGAPYTAKGLAVRGPQALVATVVWAGLDAPYFHVTLATPAGATVRDVVFPGDESWPIGVGPGAGAELLWYHGWSADPSVRFDVRGAQENGVGGPAYSNMVYVGNLEDYQLLLAVNFVFQR